MEAGLGQLIDVSGFPARWDCGDWTQLHGWTHVASDLAIWAAYVSIPASIALYVVRRRDVPFPRLFWLFAAFIFFCGTTHLMDAVIFWWPAYRLNAVFKVLTAVASWATVLVILGQAPQLLGFPSLSALNQRLLRESAARASVEKALVERSNLLHMALAAGHAGAWTFDFSTQKLTRYPSLSRLLGLPEELVTESSAAWRARIHPEDRESASATVDKAMAERTPFDMRYRIVLPSGEPRWVASRGDVIFGEDGRPVGFAGIVSDISKDVAAERARARLAAIVESASDAIIGQTPEGVITEWNRGAEELYGWTAEEIIGRSIQTIVPQSHVQELTQFLAAAAEGHSIGPFETIRKARDGRLIPIEKFITPVCREDGVLLGISSVDRDISARHDHERELRRINQALKHRSDEMEQFLYTVSHDLKSPLVTIVGFAGVISDELGSEGPPELRDAVERIERAATRMTNLIDDLLEVSRVGHPPQRPALLDLDALVEELAADFSEPLEEIGATLKVVHPLPQVRADPQRFRQVLENLLLNAMKYGCSSRKARIEIGGQREGSEICLYVRDFGKGVPEPHRERVFQLFHRLELETEGSGLGLALVRRIMSAHQGRVWLEDTPGGGATVRLALPAEPEERNELGFSPRF